MKLCDRQLHPNPPGSEDLEVTSGKKHVRYSTSLVFHRIFKRYAPYPGAQSTYRRSKQPWALFAVAPAFLPTSYTVQLTITKYVLPTSTTPSCERGSAGRQAPSELAVLCHLIPYGGFLVYNFYSSGGRHHSSKNQYELFPCSESALLTKAICISESITPLY